MLKKQNVKKAPITSIIGIVLIGLIPLLVLFGVITPEAQEPLQGYITQLLAAISTHEWATLLTVLAGILGLFLPDPKLRK